MTKAKKLRSEFVVGMSGRARRRSDDTINAKIPTGEVEVVVSQLTILNEAKTPAFPVADDTLFPRTCASSTAISTCVGRGCRATSSCGIA
jgi:aspartyl-tRNA synthetase